MEIIARPSPNFNNRRGGAVPDMVVLHYTAMDCEGALERLCAPEHEVSAHYLISETGAVYGLVAEAARAWHAGAGAWGDVQDVNSRSIGIELVNMGDQPYPEPQMVALERLLAEVRARWAIAPERVIGHSDMAPERKTDPGPCFDWRRLARAGHAVWPSAREAGDPAAFEADARAFGYRAGGAVLLAAFRSRFRPGAGQAAEPDATDAALAADLAARFPCR